MFAICSPLTGTGVGCGTRSGIEEFWARHAPAAWPNAVFYYDGVQTEGYIGYRNAAGCGYIPYDEEVVREVNQSLKEQGIDVGGQSPQDVALEWLGARHTFFVVVHEL